MNAPNYVLPTPQESPWQSLNQNQILRALEIRDFMLGEGRMNPDPDFTLNELSGRFLMRECGCKYVMARS